MAVILPASFWLLLMFCFHGCLLLREAFGLRQKSYPLPVFRQVEMKRMDETGFTSITVHYNSDDPPHCDWLVNQVPFVGGEGEFTLTNHFEVSQAGGRATITVPYSVGRTFAVCLQTLGERSCLELRPLDGYFTQESSDVHLPWPFVLPVTIHFNPVPIARYETGEETHMFAYKMNTWPYTHQGRFVFVDPRQGLNGSLPRTGLREAESIGMEGGRVGDIVTLEPVRSGSVGWMMTVATDEVGYEGVLFYRTTIAPIPFSVVAKSVTTRTIYIYNRRHSAPFPDNFAAMLPHKGDNLPVTCRSQSNWTCLLACPFAINGDVDRIELNLSRIYGNGQMIVYLHRPTVSAEIRRTGKYLAEARFLLKGEDRAEAGIYRCSVSLDGYRTLTFVNVTLV